MTGAWHFFDDDTASFGRSSLHPDAPGGGSGPGSARVPGPIREVIAITIPALDSPAGRHLLWEELTAAVRAEKGLAAVRRAFLRSEHYVRSDLVAEYGSDLTQELLGLVEGFLKSLSTFGLVLAGGVGLGAVGFGLFVLFSGGGEIGFAIGFALGEQYGYAVGMYVLDALGLYEAGGNLVDFAKQADLAWRLFRTGVKTAWDAPQVPSLETHAVDIAARQIALGFVALLKAVLHLAIAVLAAKATDKGLEVARDRLPEKASDVRVSGADVKRRFDAFIKANWKRLEARRR